eukprot:TRINITY_DN5883_c0_g1_i1.p1 TRINITY_DN5883_c0_g1~~TRINITY_DN5883_c0_g1_i1.p1  ORF type:complete len:529 (-),score=129.75 TRINITY_DN5883_c0_g1_i1:21-1607(-)
MKRTLLCVLFCTILVHIISAAQTFEGFRAVQLKLDGKLTGSTRAAFSLPAATLAAKTYLRHILLIRAHDLCIPDVGPYLKNLIDERRAEGAIVILPNTGAWPSEVSAQCALHWASFENSLQSLSFEVPIYFVFDSEALQNTYASVEASDKSIASAFAEKFYFDSNVGEPSPVTGARQFNLQGTLAGSSPSSSVVAIMAHYDSWGVAPGMATNGGTGAIALLQIARLFSDFNSARGMPASYSLVFVLTGAGRQNFGGAQQWVESTETTLLDNVEFAVCLDDLLGADLNLYIAKQPTSKGAQALLGSFAQVASEIGIKLNTVVAKAHTLLNSWDHEPLARRKINSGTFSSRSAPLAPLQPEPLIFDHQPQAQQLLRNSYFIAESIARHIYGHAGVGIFINEDDTPAYADGSEVFVNSWLDAFANISRATPFLKSSDQILSGLEKALTSSTVDITRSPLPLSYNATFYGNVRSDLTASRAKPALFDVALIFGIGAYAVALYALLVGLSKFTADVRGIISGGSSIKTTKSKK